VILNGQARATPRERSSTENFIVLDGPVPASSETP
jgi:hypothetical protein